MRAFLLLPIFLLGGSLTAGTLEFKDHNFAIDLPEGWTQFDPPGTQFVLAARDATGQQQLLVGTAKLPEGERAIGASEIREGIKKGYLGTKLTIDGEESTTIGAIPFLVLKAHIGPTGHATAYVTGAGAEAYAIQFISKDGSGDADAQSILQSFHLLNPEAFSVASAPEPSAAYKAGLAFGRSSAFGAVIAIVLLGAAGIVFLIMFVAGRLGKKN